nr:immunoglobulin light chain junction region [Macaca mulatta]MOV67382.1 immunoglobulin light chain junction region [Macaca mulatta]MOV68192.1 immunoglobulin light chain junction region [Macaca mulatta]MOV68577.1 immunoglobulin light chain junction region [Macaca mulatta]MOV69495.1 immunoglobulin light chain junction region [Macaca mulatta]
DYYCAIGHMSGNYVF